MEWFRIFKSPCFPVVLLLFMDSCSKIGLVKAMGVLLDDLSKDIPTDSADFGITIGIFYAVGSFTSPIVSTLFTRISSPRLLILLGALLGNSVTILACLASSNIHLLVIFAVSGIGHSIVLMTCMITLDRIAGDSFNLLFGISTSGNSFGMVLLPFLAEELLVVYEWHGVLLILGGIMLNAIPCAMAIRITKEDLAAIDDVGLERNNQVNNEAHWGISQSVSGGEDDRYSLGEATAKDPDDMAADNDMAPLLTPSKERIRVMTIDSDQSSSHELAHKNRLNSINSIPGKISSWFRSTDIYADPCPISISLSDTLLHFVLAGWHIFLVPHALQRGISPSNTIIITFVAAIGNLSMRLAVAFLTHKLFDPVSIHLFLTVCNIISLSCDAYVSNFYVMLVTSWCSATAIAGRATLGPLAMRGRVSSENIPIALSVNYVVGECGIFLGGYLSGLVADRFSSFDATFKLLAVIEIFTFVFMLLPKLVKKPNQS